MDTKTVISAKGQVVIPKLIREAIGLHYGSELLIHVRSDDVLEFKPIKRDLADFFGMGSRRIKSHRYKTPINIDEAIAEAVLDNEPTKKKDNS